MGEDKFYNNNTTESFYDGEIDRVKNLDRRRSRNEKKLAEEKEPPRKMKLIKKSNVNPKEKDFVGKEYGGKCQICGTTIVTRNREKYFVAANFLDTKHLEEKYLRGYSIGYNTLCLCPNCNAKWKYSAKSLGSDFKEKVLKTVIDEKVNDMFKFDIELQGKKQSLSYTPKHLFNLKDALQYWNHIENVERIRRWERKDDIEDSALAKELGIELPVFQEIVSLLQSHPDWDDAEIVQMISWNLE